LVYGRKNTKKDFILLLFLFCLLILSLSSIIPFADADTTVSFTSSSADGYMYSPEDVSYTTAWNNPTSRFYPAITDPVAVCGQSTNGTVFAVFRSYLYFDTSSLSGKIIIGATLSLYGYCENLGGIANVTIQNGQPTYPHNVLESGDFNKDHYSGNGGSAVGWSSTGYYNITLNNYGISWINTDGMTKFCIREGEREVRGTPPVVVNE
jgi:hypothetical protein